MLSYPRLSAVSTGFEFRGKSEKHHDNVNVKYVAFVIFMAIIERNDIIYQIKYWYVRTLAELCI